jgi:endonuclease/exonuclease/phosphatase (EEP) superfamily protein YafD
LIGQSSAERDAVLMDTALRMRAEGGPAVVAGDFNATPWTPVVRRLSRLAHANDPRVGRGWFPTWKANSMILRWPLDHVLTTQQFALGEYDVLPPFGSDHQAVLATLCLAPGSPPAPDALPGDVDAARHAVRRVARRQAVPPS